MSCSNSDNSDSPQEYTGIPLVILDTDIGSSTDDLFALEMLYRYEEQGRCRLLGVIVDREGEQNAVFTRRSLHALRTRHPDRHPECATIFTPSATGHFRYQMAGDAVWSATMLEKIRTFNKIH